jgi:GTP-binding protein HflX
VGAEAFLKRLDDVLAESQKVLNLSVPLSDGAALAWLYQHGDVLDRVDDDECANLRVGLDEANAARFAQRGSARTP